MVSIFLSHNTRDRQWCEWLKQGARDLGINAYLAEHDVQPGVNLAQKVTAAIDASEAVVVLLTDNSAAAPYVHQEVGYALKAGKLVIPLVQPGLPERTLAMLQGVERIPFDFDRPHEGHAALRKALQRLVRQHDERVARERDTALLVLACLALVILALNGE